MLLRSSYVIMRTCTCDAECESQVNNIIEEVMIVSEKYNK